MAGLIVPQHQDEDAAREHLEKTLWPDGPVCPHCGIIGEAFRLQGKTTRKGLWKCSACRQPFTVTVGTIFEDSKVPLHKWLLAIHLMCASKKGISAHQLMRELELGSYRTAWFMAHRVRWALGQEPIASKMTGIVEVDETYIGGKVRTGPLAVKPGVRAKDRVNPIANKAAVVSMLQRDGEVRSAHVERVTAENLRPMINEAIDQSAHIMTDSSTVLKAVPMGQKHSQVNHKAKEYVRHEDGVCITTNTIESYFAIIKRGNYGVFHHWGQQYTDQYLREYDFRYNNRKVSDDVRTERAIKKTSGKRLMLKNPKSKQS